MAKQLVDRLPRWLLWLLVGVYALPGLLARDPWRPEDATGFGIAATMAEGGWRDWVLPNVYGAAVAEEGPLTAWVGALFGKAWIAAGLSNYWLDDIIRCASVLWLLLLVWVIWSTAFRLARRPELQLPDPLGIAPSRDDYALTVADAAVLCLLATLGLLLRAHQTVAEVGELTGLALILLAAVRALDRPKSAGWTLGVGIVVAIGAGGLVHTIALLGVLIVSSSLNPMLRFGLGQRLLRAACVVVVAAAAWLYCLHQFPEGPAWLGRWLTWNREQLALPFLGAGGSGQDIGRLFKNAVWFLWPIWPLSCWTLWHHRGSLREPGLRIPAIAAAAHVVSLPWLSGNIESHLFPLIVPLTLLAALGLSSLRRGLISLIDWFAVMVFSTAGLLVWIGWSALNFGFPPKIARNFLRLAPDYVAQSVPLELLIAVLACAAWIALVVWRVRTHPRALWQATALSSGGMTLIWLLLMTLWLPWINQGKTYRPVADSLRAALAEQDGCVATRNLGLAQRASLVYLGNVAVRRDAYARKNLSTNECPWLLIQDNPTRQAPHTPDLARWQLRWEGKRASDRNEGFRLFRQKIPAP
jgi:4-amino-4-deoxy-L-arabinose transferase-like glycosyltransferase